MEELLKDNYLIIIICLSVITLLMFSVVLVDQLYIIKGMAEKIKKMAEKIRELNGALQKWNTWYNVNIRPYQKQQGGVQRQVVQHNNKYQQPSNHATHCSQQLRDNVGTVERITNVSQNNKEAVSSGTPIATNKPTNSLTYNYLQEATGGKFLKLMPTSNKCFFRTWEKGGVRKYEFCGNVAKALANINAIFDDVCEIEGKRSGATDIENVSAGILDSELRITSKAKIRLK